MKGIILAAGRGSRMSGLTEKQPKCRVLLHGRQLIEWQLDSLKKGGVDEVAIVRGYLADSFKYPFKYFENKRWFETNMVMSLTAAAEWLEKEACVISYSDIVYTPNTVSDLVNASGDITVAYDPNWRRLWDMRFNDPLLNAETFQIHGDSVSEIGGRAENIEEIKGQYIGLFRITPDGWSRIKSYLCTLPDKVKDSLDITGMMSRLIKMGIVVTGMPIKDNWYEIDSEKDLNCYQALASLW